MAQEYLLLETGDHLLLESGDDLLLESSVVDQTIDLPLIDDSAIMGPTITGAGSIDLPLIDDSAIFGPTFTSTVTITLPLIDDSAIFGPTVVVDQSLTLPLIDDSAIYEPTISFDQALTLPLIDGGWAFAPTVLGTVVEGLVVKVVDPDSGPDDWPVLDDSSARSWLDELAGPGQWRMSLPNDDAAMPAFGEIVTFELDGQIRFAGPVEAKGVAEYAAGEAVDEVTVLSGRGRLAVTKGSVIAPSRGWDALPVEVTRSQSWVSVDFDDAGWSRAVRTRRADILTPFTPGSRAIPEWWPDKTAWWVAPLYPGVTPYAAPAGRSLYRSDPITLAAGTIAVLAGFNNLGDLYFDGSPMGSIENNPVDGNRVDFDVSAGDHIIAASVTNYIRDTGFIASIYTVDAEGLLDELVWSSDSNNMRALGYPTVVPGFTPGKALRLLLEEAQADGEMLDVTLGFTDTLDSDGVPWASVVEITADVGRKFMEHVESLQDWLIDAQMAPGANVLRAWDWGTRGGTPGVTITATTDRNTSEVEALSFDGRDTRVNRLRIRYRHGYTVVDESGADDPVTDFLDLSDIESESTAQTIGRRLLTLRKDPSYAGSLVLASVALKPYDTFDNGDTIGHPADPASQNTSRVRSIACDEDGAGELTFPLELNDVRREAEDRQENWLKRTQMGALAGGARVTSRRGDPIPPARRVAAKDVAELSFDGEPGNPLSLVRAAATSGNLIEAHVEITLEDDDVPTTTATSFRILLGNTVLDTVTVAAGETEAEVDLEAQKVYRNVSKIRAELVSFGTGARGASVQVRAI